MFALFAEVDSVMHTLKRVPKPLPSILHAARNIKRSASIRVWELSGLLVTHYYARLLSQHGRSPKALAERDSDKDLVFYQHLFEGIELHSPVSVLDIGCGMGDLIDYLQSRDVTFSRYLGIDLVEDFVDLCQREYLDPCRFQQQNFISDSFAPGERFDLVVNMGVLVSRVIGYESYIAYSVEKMLAYSTKHVLFNVITDVDPSLGNYRSSSRVGQITSVPKQHLEQVLARATRDYDVEYAIQEARIYPDATDAFVRITRR